jgi:hypothetical protein
MMAKQVGGIENLGCTCEDIKIYCTQREQYKKGR